jgi:DNA gyrase subunit A
VLLVTERGMLIRMPAGEIRRIGRATLGVRLIRLDEGDRLVAVALAESADEEDDEGDEPQEGESAGETAESGGGDA